MLIYQRWWIDTKVQEDTDKLSICPEDRVSEEKLASFLASND